VDDFTKAQAWGLQYEREHVREGGQISQNEAVLMPSTSQTKLIEKLRVGLAPAV